MKTIVIFLPACIIFFILSQTFTEGTGTNKDAAIRTLAYKQQYALSCGAATVTGNDISSTFPKERENFWTSFNTQTPQYNTLWIPDTLGGTVFNLRIHDTIKQYFTGASTNTMAYNNNASLGPTLILQKGTTVQMHVKNDLADSTTVHWHGMHLPAIMDGGPYQPIAPGTKWNPTWVVKNNAATYWYHPHLHMKTTDHLVMGLTGMIIVRDATEKALNLPRTYGVDDIPLILNDKRFNSTSNQFEVSHFGDTMMCNGTLHAQYNIPAQVIRFRLLDAATERSYNIGFSDDRTFYVAASDAGLLNKPVAVKSYILSPGERIEILVDFSAQENQSITLRALNSKLPNGIAGSEPDNNNTPPTLRNKLGHRDFDILRLNITTKKINAVTSIPSTLVTNSSIDSASASVTRKINITDGGTNCSIPSYGCYKMNSKYHDMNRIDYKIKKDATEIWEISNNSNIAHPFHIHDISFKILSKTDGALTECDKGWKDVVLVRKGATVRLIATFADYADSVHPYMYHCHISMHEDAGMMGQFVVMPKNAGASLNSNSTLLPVYTSSSIKVVPNPISNAATISFTLTQPQKISISISDINGRLVKILSGIQMEAGTQQLIWNANDEKGNTVNAGIYFLRFRAGTYTETKKLLVVKK